MTKEERIRIMRRVRAAQPDVKFYVAESQLLQLSNFTALAAFAAHTNAAHWGKLNMGENLTSTTRSGNLWKGKI